MPELDPFDSALTTAVRAFADRASTAVDAAAVAERAIGRRRVGMFAWLGRPLPVSASMLLLAGLLLALFGWSVGSGGRWRPVAPAPAPTGIPMPTVGPPTDGIGPEHVSGSETYALTTEPQSTDEGGANRLRDGAAIVVATMSDTRVSGVGTFRFSVDTYPVIGPEWGAYHLENEGGAWDGTCSGGTRDGVSPAIWTCWLVGSGGYEGYTYYRHVTSTPGEVRARVEGIVFPGSPPAP